MIVRSDALIAAHYQRLRQLTFRNLQIAELELRDSDPESCDGASAVDRNRLIQQVNRIRIIVSFDLHQAHVELRIEILRIVRQHYLEILLRFVELFQLQILRSEIVARREILRINRKRFLKVRRGFLKSAFAYRLQPEVILPLRRRRY